MIPKRLRAPALALLAASVLTGCSQWRYDLGDHLTAADIPDLSQPNTLASVLAQLGPPQRMSSTDSGYVMAWEHWSIAEDTIGISLGAMGAQFISLDWGDAQVQGDFLLLTFDRSHMLTAAAFSEWDNDSGDGTAIQPFISPISLVEISDLTRRMPQHRWGFTAMKPVPRALNRQSDLDSGESGLEQRGTPESIGQRALEMQ